MPDYSLFLVQAYKRVPFETLHFFLVIKASLGYQFLFSYIINLAIELSVHASFLLLRNVTGE